ncbi:hypothetical protein AMS68_000391 [Peltaster fructicola]|uniref:DUF788 domain protein n=1 Tax=Peltaster fructicola TaxID=286661 RepID=A0A6H0XJI1_9PEZI|nr:hypothetical protein AMS68_000391 [Peltaster fructicola]
MAQKALKTLAARNAAILNRTHLITLGVNGLFLLIHFLLSQRNVYQWVLFSLPALTIEFWFERIARPTYVDAGAGKELKRAGEDLEAKGLTEWMWDVLYWSWGCTALVTLFGNRLWWAYLAVPLYSAYLAFTTFSGARQGLAGLGGAGDAGATGAAAQSKRQAKLEKRGGQRVQYR